MTSSHRTTAGRFLQVIFWIFVIIFIGAYIATFAADRIVDRLADDEDALSIKSVDDLASQDEIKYGILRAGSTYDYFRVSFQFKYFRAYLFKSCIIAF